MPSELIPDDRTCVTGALLRQVYFVPFPLSATVNDQSATKVTLTSVAELILLPQKCKMKWEKSSRDQKYRIVPGVLCSSKEF